MGSLPAQQNVSQSETPGEPEPPPISVKKAAEQTPGVDIYDYLHQLEMDARMRPSPDYIEKVQKEISIDLRGSFVDWLAMIADKCRLPPDILYLTVSYVDRYLSMNAVDRNSLHLLGISSMIISLKYEHKHHPHPPDLCYITGSGCTALEAAKMEARILNSLNFEIGNPTIIMFLRKFTRVAQEEYKISDMPLEFLVDYLAELSLLDYHCLKFVPSLVAASVVFLSKFTIRSNWHPWSSALQKESGYEPAHLKECVHLIHDLQTSRRGGRLKAVRNKYKQDEFKCVSELFSPATIPAFFFDEYLYQLEGLKNAAKETPGVYIYEYLHQLEGEARRRPLPAYIEKVQEDFTSDVRSIFVDWVFKVAEKCKLRSDVLHLTISNIDRYLSVKAVDRQRLQLLGVSSMLISLKYEYKVHPSANDLCNITGANCTKLEVVKMEAEILESLKFEVGNPTVYTFLRKFTRVAQEEGNIFNLRLEFLADYLAKLSLLEYKCVKFLPSLVAASVVFLSIFTIKPNLHPWSSVLQQESGYEPAKLKECVLLIHDWQKRRKGGGILNALRNKYKQHEFKCVSELYSPATIPSRFFDDVRS